MRTRKVIAVVVVIGVGIGIFFRIESDEIPLSPFRKPAVKGRIAKAEGVQVIPPSRNIEEEALVSLECKSEWNELAVLRPESYVLVKSEDRKTWGLPDDVNVEASTAFRETLESSESVGRCAKVPEPHPLFCPQLHFATACGPFISKKAQVLNMGRYELGRVNGVCAERRSEFKGGEILVAGTDPVRRRDELQHAPFDARFRSLDQSLAAKMHAMECYEKALLYRMEVLAYQARDLAINQINDPEILNAVFLTSLSAGGEHLGRARESGRRAAELRPTDKYAARMWAFAEITATTREEGNLEMAAKSREHLRAVDPESPYTAELFLNAYLHQGDHERIEREVQSLRGFPNASVGLYYLAWSAYANGNREGARKHLREAANALPADSRVRYTQQLFELGLVGQKGIEPFVSYSAEASFAFR